MRARLAAVEGGKLSASKCVAAFDLDNTLFDSRARTLAAAHAFDAEQGSQHFAELTLPQVALDARQTCARLGGIPEAVVDAFDAYWSRAFWQPAQFALDPPLEPVLDWVRAAHDRGVNVRYVTGRAKAYGEPSLAQLHRAGLTFAEAAHLHLKPSIRVDTMEHKRSALARLQQASTVLWYVTESRHEIVSLQEALPGFPLVLLDCTFERGGPAVAPGTPMLPAVF